MLLSETTHRLSTSYFNELFGEDNPWLICCSNPISRPLSGKWLMTRLQLFHIYLWTRLHKFLLSTLRNPFEIVWGWPRTMSIYLVFWVSAQVDGRPLGKPTICMKCENLKLWFQDWNFVKMDDDFVKKRLERDLADLKRMCDDHFKPGFEIISVSVYHYYYSHHGP